jgi:hypothetical protein
LEGLPLSQSNELSREKSRIKALTEKTVANGYTEVSQPESRAP